MKEKAVREGDQCVIWQTNDKDHRRGVVAFGAVLGNPKKAEDGANPYWVDRSRAREGLRVPVRYLLADGLPLWTSDASSAETLESLNVARARGGTVFRLTQAEWDNLVALAGGRLYRNSESLDAQHELRDPFHSHGQGRGRLTIQERRVVELHAMECAKKYFSSGRFHVEDVSSNSSYDLLCTRDAERLCVEVKGTTSDGESIILTDNEIKVSERYPYAIFVVSDILLVKSTTPTASGGHPRLYSAWKGSDHKLEPIAFKCVLNRSKSVVVDVG